MLVRIRLAPLIIFFGKRSSVKLLCKLLPQALFLKNDTNPNATTQIPFYASPSWNKYSRLHFHPFHNLCLPSSSILISQSPPPPQNPLLRHSHLLRQRFLPRRQHKRRRGILVRQISSEKGVTKEERRFIIKARLLNQIPGRLNISLRQLKTPLPRGPLRPQPLRSIYKSSMAYPPRMHPPRLGH